MPNRPIIRQADFFAIPYIAEKVTESDGENAGGLTRAGIRNLIEYPEFRMIYEVKMMAEMKMSGFNSLLKKSPILIGFNNPNGQGNHLNVIVNSYDIKWGGGTVIAMELYSGQFVNRPFSYYTHEGTHLGYA